MSGAQERLHYPASTAELNRRWDAIRKSMADRRIDVLIMQANNDFMGGYVKWFSDISATNGYAVSLVFPRETEMIFIGQGPFGMDRKLSDDPAFRGVGRMLGVPSYASAGYSLDYELELMARALEPFVGGVIGLVGQGTLPYGLIEGLKRGAHSNSTFVDASTAVDEIKAIKSAEELVQIRLAARMQDTCFEAVLAAIRPGLRDIEVAAIAEQVGHALGSEQGVFHCGSAPVGAPQMFGQRRMQNRTLREGDYFTILIENSGPGGYYAELGRTIVLGKASERMLIEQTFVMEAQDLTAALLRPGADCKDIWEAYNDFMQSSGRPREQRLFCHSQGYDMVERPLVRFDEPMPIKADMCVSCHPTYATESTFSWACDNYLVGDATTERIHATERRIFEQV